MDGIVTDTLARAGAQRWLGAFAAALASQDSTRVASLFADECHWRDILAFTWNLHTTTGRTGVLIFVSIAEKRVEIIADSGIDAQVEKGIWQKIVDDFTADIGAGRAVEGFERAIGRIGELLAQHFPPRDIDPNELPDHLIVLRN